jgi:hypothetical protein
MRVPAPSTGPRVNRSRVAPRSPVTATGDLSARKGGSRETETVPLGEERDRVEVDLELMAVDDLADRGGVSL